MNGTYDPFLAIGIRNERALHDTFSKTLAVVYQVAVHCLNEVCALCAKMHEDTLHLLLCLLRRSSPGH